MSILDDIQAENIQLNPSAKSIILSAGVRTAQDLDSLLTAFPSLAVDFGIPSARITAAFMPGFSAVYASAVAGGPPPPMPAMGAVAPPGVIHGLGTRAGIPSQPSIPITHPSVTSTTTAIDLRLHPWPVRDQGRRGTCVAFGATACVEYWQGANQPSVPDFSEQFLYYQIKTNSGDPSKTTDGTWLQFARDMFIAPGICHERFAPYVGPIQTGAVAGAPPSQPAITDARGFMINPPTYQRKPASPAATVLSLLGNGRPVAASFPVFTDPTTGINNWGSRVGILYGKVFDPPFHSVANAGHCVCITGFVPDAAEPTGGYFIFRNSWNTTWSSASPSPGNSHAPEAGYGEISATYVDTYCWELLQL